MANESKINFTVSPAEWHANEYLYSYALNGQVNANRNLITAIIEGLNPFYKNANDRDGTISDPASVSTNATLIKNALLGILDTTKSGVNIDIKSGADITLEAASGKLIEAKSDVKIDQNATFANENPIVTITRNLILKGTQGNIKIGEYDSSEANSNFDNFDVTTKNRVGLYQRTISGGSNIRTEHAKFVAQIDEYKVHQDQNRLISDFIIGEKGDDYEDIGLFYNASLDNGYNWHLNHNAFELNAYGKTSNSMWYNLELTEGSFEVSGSTNNWKMIASDDDLIVSNTATNNQLYSIVTNIEAKVLKEKTYPNGIGIIGNDGGDIYLLNKDASNDHNLRCGLHITENNIYIQRGNNAPENLFGKQPKLYEHRIKMTFPSAGANQPEITVYFSFSNTYSQSYHTHMPDFFTYLHKNVNSAYNVSGIDLDTGESYFVIPQYIDSFNTHEVAGSWQFTAKLHYVLVSATNNSNSIYNDVSKTVTTTTSTSFTKAVVDRECWYEAPADDDKIFDDVLPL